MTNISNDDGRCNTLLETALDYVALNPGRYIFPIKARAKFPPLVQDNLASNASDDPEQIKRWAAKWPGCNWGLAHRKSRVFVVDVDCNAAKGKIGQKTFDELDLDYGFPETEITTTPSGGFHHIYEGEHVFALGEHGLGRDVDSPNYTLIPGCVLKDGSAYVGNDKVAVPCPQWIYDRLKITKTRIAHAGEVVVDLDTPEMVEWAIDYLKNDAEPAIEGRGGDHRTLTVAMSLKDNGISETAALELMLEHYNPRCEPPWELEGIEKKITNAYSYANLHKTGEKTAQADFTDDDAAQVAATVKPRGNASRIADQVRQRKQDRTDGVAPLTESNRSKLVYRVQDMPRAVHQAMQAIRADKKHDHIFRRGPEIVRLNQNLTTSELEGKKPTDVKRKLGSLVIREVVADYMALRLAEAARFYVKGKPMGRPKKDSAEKET